MDVGNVSVKFSEIKQDALLADLYSKLYTIPKGERVKVLMSWVANAYSDMLIPLLSVSEVMNTYIINIRLLDTFANNSSYDVVAQLASEFSETFLACQVIPNLLENYDKTADITYYLQVLCENITCPSIIRKVIDLVTTKLSPILIGRMRSDNVSIATSTLSLIKTLLEFYCEDLWYELILQYLLPMKHLLTSQRQKMLPEIEFHESTHKLLESIPKFVDQNIDSSVLTEHFLAYFQSEIIRLRSIDSAVASSNSELRQSEIRAQESEGDGYPRQVAKSTTKNPTYPLWQFKYDGTDFLHALRRGFLLEEPEEFFEDDLFSVANQLNTSTPSSNSLQPTETDSGAHGMSLSRSQVSNDPSNFDLANISVAGAGSDHHNGSFQFTVSEPGDFDSLGSSQGPDSLTGIVKDKRKSFSNALEVDTHSPYFGPFLHSIYEILRSWSSLHPDILFTATGVISVLASSRIPLLNSLFLDMSLTLQPSYPSFSSILHSIRSELDKYLINYPDNFFRSVWSSAANEADPNSTQFSSNGESPSPSSSFMSSLKRSITTNRSFRMASEEMDRSFGRRRGSFRAAFSDIFKSSRETTRPSELRLLGRAASSFESDEDEQAAKVMAMRSVLFTHWMLELGAIALQLCWGRKSLHGAYQWSITSVADGVKKEENVNSSLEGGTLEL